MTGDTLRVLLPLAVVWGAAVVLPGPNFLVVVWVAAARGRRDAVLAALGVLTGALFWISAGLFGLKALFVALPFAGAAIRLIGAAYLIWFGLQMIFRPAAAVLDGATAASSYRAGLATNLSNPKSAAVAASLLAVALPEGAPALLGVEAFLLLIAISSSWYLSVAVVGSMPAVVHAFVAARRRITQGAGALFVLFGLRLALER
jgi:threonine/homoserine/homoserine lactone efflux protein